MNLESRLAGAVLGAAIGDALGYPVEFLRSFQAIRARCGPQGVRDLEPTLDQGGRRVARISDDTQMAMVVLRTLIASRKAGLDLDATLVGALLGARRSPSGGSAAWSGATSWSCSPRRGGE